MSPILDAVWPYATMFVSAFVSATLLPFASEAVLFGGLKAGVASTIGLVAVATAGNVGGSAVNWWMGGMIRRFEGRSWFPFKPETIAAATQRFQHHGAWILLLSWVPVIGDPLTLVAGIMRVPLMLFLLLVTIGKGARYIAIAAFA